MTNSIVTYLDMDFQDVKDFNMDLHFTDKIESKIWEILHSYTQSKLIPKDIFFKMISTTDMCELASLFFERDKEDMLFIYDNNDVHGLYEASLLTIKSLDENDLIEAAVKFKKVLLSHYLPEIKKMVEHCYDEFMSSYFSDNQISTSVDLQTGEVCHFSRFGHQLAI